MRSERDGGLESALESNVHRTDRRWSTIFRRGNSLAFGILTIDSEFCYSNAVDWTGEPGRRRGVKTLHTSRADRANRRKRDRWRQSASYRECMQQGTFINHEGFNRVPETTFDDLTKTAEGELPVPPDSVHVGRSDLV